tara:strand:+ start:1439 stop:1993 length:555 start_codon:yes stop_codon:yes gene_type:complete
MTTDEKTEDANEGDNVPISEEEPIDELSIAKKELEDMKDKFARSMADLDNFKKRIERDKEQQNLKSRGLAVLSFLEVAEIIDKASKSDYPDLASAVEGINGIDKFTKSFLESMKVERFNPIGESFDFRFHEAMTTIIKEDIEPHTIVDVIQAGYLLEGELLRPAKVVVSKKEEKDEQKEEKKGE